MNIRTEYRHSQNIRTKQRVGQNIRTGHSGSEHQKEQRAGYQNRTQDRGCRWCRQRQKLAESQGAYYWSRQQSWRSRGMAAYLSCSKHSAIRTSICRSLPCRGFLRPGMTKTNISHLSASCDAMIRQSKYVGVGLLVEIHKYSKLDRRNVASVFQFATLQT